MPLTIPDFSGLASQWEIVWGMRIYSAFESFKNRMKEYYIEDIWRDFIIEHEHIYIYMLKLRGTSVPVRF